MAPASTARVSYRSPTCRSPRHRKGAPTDANCERPRRLHSEANLQAKTSGVTLIFSGDVACQASRCDDRHAIRPCALSLDLDQLIGCHYLRSFWRQASGGLFVCSGGLDASRRQLQSGMGLCCSRSELPADSACFRSRRRHRRDGKRRGRFLVDGSAVGGGARRGTHFGAAGRAGAAGAQRADRGATANTVRTAVRTCLGVGGAAHECARCDAAARRGCRRSRGRGFSRSQRVRRRVDEAARAHRCRSVRISANNGGGSAACACCCEREQCRAGVTSLYGSLEKVIRACRSFVLKKRSSVFR